jgi:GNAT superfamily N-acetyltransferase
VIREGTLDDVPAAAALRRRVWPHAVITDEAMRHHLQTVSEAAKLHSFAYERDGELLGWVGAGWAWYQEQPTRGFLGLAVDPEHRRTGIGSALADAADAHLKAIGVTITRSDSLDLPDAREFASGRGFVEVGSAAVSAVDPRTVEPLPIPPGTEILSLTELDDPRALYELDSEVSLDVPNEVYEGVSYEEWLAEFWDSPMLDHEASVVAVVDGALAALTLIRVDIPSGRGENNLAGTRRAFRGRGLATLVKSHSLARAAARGVTVVVTDNEERNAPMLAINTRLGYRPFARQIRWERDTTTPG